MTEQTTNSPSGIDINISPNVNNAQTPINDLVDRIENDNLSSSSKTSNSNSQNSPPNPNKSKNSEPIMKKRTSSYSNLPDLSLLRKPSFLRRPHKYSTLTVEKSQTTNPILYYFDESSKFLSNLKQGEENPYDNNYMQKPGLFGDEEENSQTQSQDNEQNPNYLDMDFFKLQTPKKQQVPQTPPNQLFPQNLIQNQINNYHFSSQNDQRDIFDNNSNNFFIQSNFNNNNSDNPPVRGTSFNSGAFLNPFMTMNNNNINNNNNIPSLGLIPNISLQAPNILQQKLNPEDYLFEKFGKKGWQCQKCNNFNFETRQKCNRCGLNMMPKILSKSKRDELNNPDEKRKKPLIERKGDWVCLKCKNLNFAFRTICNRCQLPKNDVNNVQQQFQNNNNNKFIMINMNHGQFPQNYINQNFIGQQNQNFNYIDPQLVNKNINIFNNFYNVGMNQKPTFSANLNAFEQNNMKNNYMQQVPTQVWWNFMKKNPNNIKMQNNFRNENNNIQYSKNFNLMDNNNSEESD